MLAEDVLFWTTATPFRAFRIIMNSGRTYEVRHPELVRILTGSLVFFTPSRQEGIYDRAEMIGLVLIDKIELVDAQTPAGGDVAR